MVQSQPGRSDSLVLEVTREAIRMAVEQLFDYSSRQDLFAGTRAIVIQPIDSRDRSYRSRSQTGIFAIVAFATFRRGG